MERLLSRPTIVRISLIVLVFFILTYIYAVTGGRGILDRFGGVIGGDFIEFYTAGKIIDQGQARRLYDPDFQLQTQQAVAAPHITLRFYRYATPAFFALPFVWLSRLPYLTAFAVWSLISISLLAGSLMVLSRHLKFTAAEWAVAGLTCVSFPPFLVECLAGGQNASLSLLLLCLFYNCTKRGQGTAAGLWLAALLYKPQLVLLYPLVLGMLKCRRALGVFFLAGIALAALSVWLTGSGSVLGYAETLWEHAGYVGASGWKIWKTNCFYSFFGMLLNGRFWPTIGLTLVFSLSSLGLVVQIWRDAPGRGRAFDLRFAFTVVQGLLISPYVFVYELTLLFLPALLVLNSIREQPKTALTRAIAAVTGLLYVVCLFSDRAAKATGVQLSVPLLFLFGLLVYAQIRRQG